jgi:hypothetical protein
MLRRRFKYDVTFSFAEENHVVVEEVIYHLRSKELNYYYYKEDLIEEWGKELSKHLSGIYKRQSRLCVIFISDHYKKKVWTKHELENARKRSIKDIHGYILPFKIDDTELTEISPTIKYLSLEQVDAKKLAEAIYKKVTEHKEKDTFLRWLYVELRYLLFSSPRRIILTLMIAIVLFLFVCWDHLTPVNTLTMRLYERNKRRVKGSICNNGELSESRGPGTCSWNSGVAKDTDFIIPDKTIEECREAARDISWIPE